MAVLELKLHQQNVITEDYISGSMRREDYILLLAAEIKDLKDKLEKSKERQKQLKEDIKDLEDEVRSKDAKISDQKTQLADLRIEVSVKDKDIMDAKKTIK